MEQTRRAVQTQTRYGRLSSVFGGTTDRELKQRVARLSVLFEDLRIEIAGIAAETLPALDDTSKHLRKVYFLRRSYATLFEFVEAFEDLLTCADFAPVEARIDLPQWPRAIRFLKKHKASIERVRHNVGGHFAEGAGKLAARNLLSNAVGSVEIGFYSNGRGGAKLSFAGELAATAYAHSVGGNRSIEASIRHLARLAIVSYRHAVRAMDCIISLYLWDRFGRN